MPKKKSQSSPLTGLLSGLLGVIFIAFIAFVAYQHFNSPNPQQPNEDKKPQAEPAAPSAPSPAAPPVRYKTYRQSRWLYAIEYPEYLDQQEDSENSDGCRFYNNQGIELITYGTWNIGEKSLKALYEEKLDGVAQVTYQKMFPQKKAFVKSGYTQDGKIFYLKQALLLLDGTEFIATAQITFPKDLMRSKLYKEYSIRFPSLIITDSKIRITPSFPAACLSPNRERHAAFSSPAFRA